MTTKCDQCGKSINVKPSKLNKQSNKFCSRSCYHAHKGRNKVTIVCLKCGQSVTKSKSRINEENNFCSVKCSASFLNPEKNKKLMTMDVRNKLRATRITKGNGRTYAKLHGRHEHRVVAEQVLGRPLEKGEIVHHKDGNKRNNSPDNIQVFKNQKEHINWHRERGDLKRGIQAEKLSDISDK